MRSWGGLLALPTFSVSTTFFLRSDPNVLKKKNSVSVVDSVRPWWPLFLGPVTIAFIIGFVWPFFQGIYLSFCEFQVITDALTETVTRATQAFRDGDIPAAQRVEPLEDVIDSLSAQLRDRHVKRLQAGECEFVNSFAFDEILTDLERIGDHCSNIAACQIALSAAHMDMHAYRDAVKAGETGDFLAERRAAAEKYRLPKA